MDAIDSYLSFWPGCLNLNHRAGFTLEQTLVKAIEFDCIKHGLVFDEEAVLKAIRSEMAGLLTFTACGVKLHVRFDSAETEKLPLSAIVEKFEAPAKAQ